MELAASPSRIENFLTSQQGSADEKIVINDSIIKGGYHVVKTIFDRNNIDCCYRKKGMKVLVVGDDLSQKIFCDIFAGTGIVGRTFKKNVKKVQLFTKKA